MAGFGTSGFGSAPFGSAPSAVISGPPFYVMRARNSADNGYVHWVSGSVDIVGADASESIDPGSAVVEAVHEGLIRFIEHVVGVSTSLQVIEEPGNINNPVNSSLIVLVNVSSDDWPDGGIIVLPSPSAGALIEIKAIEDTTTVDGGGMGVMPMGTSPLGSEGSSGTDDGFSSITIIGSHLIDGQPSYTIESEDGSVQLLFTGSDWEVI
jgi:hypothetical protein